MDKNQFYLLIIVLIAIIFFLAGLNIRIHNVEEKIETLNGTIAKGFDQLTFANGSLTGFLGEDAARGYLLSGKYSEDKERLIKRISGQ